MSILSFFNSHNTILSNLIRMSELPYVYINEKKGREFWSYDEPMQFRIRLSNNSVNKITITNNTTTKILLDGYERIKM